MNRPSWHHYAWLTIVLWAGAYVFTRVALRHFSPLPLAFLRCAAASLALVVLLLVRGEPLPPLRDYPRFLASGAMGFGLYFFLFNTGAASLSAAGSCLVISVSPLLTAFMGRGLFGEKLPPLAWGAMLLEFSGLIIMTLWAGPLSINRGIFWVLAAAAAISIYNIMQRAYARSYSPLQITAFSFVVGTVLLSFSLPEAWAELKSAPGSQMAAVIFLGLGPGAAAYLAWAKALSLAGQAGAVANYMFLTPLLSFLMGYLLIAEMPDGGTLLGGLVILGGLALFSRVSRT